MDKPFRLRPSRPTPVVRPIPLVSRRHRDGTVELILCNTGDVIRYFGVDEHEAYSRMSAHLKSY